MLKIPSEPMPTFFLPKLKIRLAQGLNPVPTSILLLRKGRPINSEEVPTLPPMMISYPMVRSGYRMSLRVRLCIPTADLCLLGSRTKYMLKIPR